MKLTNYLVPEFLTWLATLSHSFSSCHFCIYQKHRGFRLWLPGCFPSSLPNLPILSKSSRISGIIVTKKQAQNQQTEGRTQQKNFQKTKMAHNSQISSNGGKQRAKVVVGRGNREGPGNVLGKTP